MQQYVDHVSFHIWEIRCDPISVCYQDVTQRKPYKMLSRSYPQPNHWGQVYKKFRMNRSVIIQAPVQAPRPEIWSPRLQMIEAPLVTVRQQPCITSSTKNCLLFINLFIFLAYLLLSPDQDFSQVTKRLLLELK